MQGPIRTWVLMLTAAVFAAGLGPALHRAVDHNTLGHETGDAPIGCCAHAPAQPAGDDGHDPAPEPPSETPGHDCDFCTVLGTLSTPVPSDSSEALEPPAASETADRAPAGRLTPQTARRDAAPRGPPALG